MDEPLHQLPWYKRPVTPRWLPDWLLACLISGATFTVAAEYALGLGNWQARGVAFGLGFGLVLAVLSLVPARPQDRDSSLFPPDRVRLPVLAVVFGFAIYTWLDKQFRGPAPPADMPRPEYALWVLWGCAGWLAVRLLWIGWDTLRSLRAGGAMAGQAPNLATFASLVAGGAAGYAAVVSCWPQAQQGWRQFFPWAAVLPGAFAGLVVDLYLDLRKGRLMSWLLSRRLPHYRAQLRASDPTQRAAAAKAIGNMRRHAAPALPGLLKALGDDSPEVRARTALAIYFIDADDPNLPSALRPRLSDSDPRVRITVAATLVARQAVPATDVLPSLAEGVLDAGDELSNMAAQALGQLGAQALPALPALRRAIFDKRPPTCGAADALGALGDPGVAVLAEALTHADPTVRWSAALVLKTLGPVARSAAPALHAAQADGDERVRRTAAQALHRMS